MAEPQYKVHVAYINYNGEVVAAGIYPQSRIDIAEARSKTIITTVDALVDVKEETPPAEVRELRFSADDSITLKTLEPANTSVKVEKLKINSADMATLEKAKGIGKATAKKIIEERNKAKFQNYPELDVRVPLRFNKAWEQTVAIDFEPAPLEITNTNTISFIKHD